MSAITAKDTQRRDNRGDPRVEAGLVEREHKVGLTSFARHQASEAGHDLHDDVEVRGRDTRGEGLGVYPVSPLLDAERRWSFCCFQFLHVVLLFYSKWKKGKNISEPYGRGEGLSPFPSPSPPPQSTVGPRTWLPVVYSHILRSGRLTAAGMHAMWQVRTGERRLFPTADCVFLYIPDGPWEDAWKARPGIAIGKLGRYRWEEGVRVRAQDQGECVTTPFFNIALE